MRASAFFLLFIIFMVCGINGSSISNGVMRKKLQIDIYYISLCPGSMEFMTTELAPAYAKFKNFINVNFIPFSQTKRIGTRTVFECMHGPDECNGNMLQSCALDALGDDQDKKVEFVVCQMHENADSTGRNCIKSLNISFGSIIQCKLGQKGFELQLRASEQARELAREVFSKSDGFYVPMAVFDKVYSESDAKKANNNFTQIIEEKLKGLQLFDEKSQESDESDYGNEEVKDADLGEMNANDSDSSEENFKESDISNEKPQELNLVDENTNDPELNSSTESHKSSARMNILCEHTFLFAVFVAFAAAI